MAKPVDIALAFTHAWTGKDFETAATYVSEDVVFDGPLQQSTGSQPYFDGLKRLAESVQGVEIVAAYGDDDRALVMYQLITGPYGKLLCAKCFTVEDGKIRKDQLTFDTFRIRSPNP